MFAFAALVFLILWLFQLRDSRAVARLSRAIQAASVGNRLAERVEFDSDHPIWRR